MARVQLPSWMRMQTSSPIHTPLPRSHLNTHRTSTRRRVHNQTPPSSNSTTQSLHNKSSPTPPPNQSADQFSRILSRIPKFLHPTVSALRNAAVAHVTSFLILHELTAVIPLFGLAGAFHYYGWLPPYFAEGKWVVEGVHKFGRYFERKGWIEKSEEREVEGAVEKDVERKFGSEDQVIGDRKQMSMGGRDEAVKNRWGSGESTRWIVEFATAYAVVKALLPVRLFVSVWAAPWFARWTVIPVGRGFRTLFGRK